ncbi:MAG: class I SAM-dependent methyltransferase [Deferribacteraceae bacterium]|nr:class I SAM-dependent methyltransferase [Deferribacteraceae bacterium]
MNLPFSANIYSEFIDRCCGDIIPAEMRRAQKEHKTPSPEIAPCRLIAFLTGMLKPRRIIDIGCGIGISTLALHLGFPQAEIYAVDGNRGRVDVCKTFLGENPKIQIFNEYAENFLKRVNMDFDLAFVDSVKKEYPNIWEALEPRLSPHAVALFDDVFLYGYIAEPDSNVPPKYKNGAKILREFVADMSQRHPSFIFPIGGGMLLVKKS